VSAETLAWLDARVSGAPPALRGVFADTVGPRDGVEDAPTIAESLARGALDLYGRVLDGSGGREDALVLLAADALLTHAFHAQAEADPERLPEFAARWGGTGAVGQLAEERKFRRAEPGR